MRTLRAINLAVLFLLELGALAAFCLWGATVPGSLGVRTAAAIGLPVVVALAWGAFISPKARVSTGHLGQAALGLLGLSPDGRDARRPGYPTLADLYATVAVVSFLLLLGPRRGGPPD